MSPPNIHPRHFLDLSRFDKPTLLGMIEQGREFKKARNGFKPLAGMTLAMIFEKPSTRTRVSFEVGMKQLGGDALMLKGDELQLGKSETIADTAKVLSRYVDAIMIRTHEHSRLLELADAATVPVINALTNETHPCQVMADVMTLIERRGSLDGAVVAWSGDGNNVATSWVHAAAILGMELRLACPEGHEVPRDHIEWARERQAKIALMDDPRDAVRGADCVITDTWVSMHNVGDAEKKRRRHLEPYQVNTGLMRLAKKDAMFMHCLPAHRGEEVTDAVLDGPQSAAWDEAENRLHVQKGILAWCLA